MRGRVFGRWGFFRVLKVLGWLLKGAVLVQMCAPYNALQSYKLKVKLTPGTQRKGRAGRQVCHPSPDKCILYKNSPVGIVAQ